MSVKDYNIVYISFGDKFLYIPHKEYIMAILLSIINDGQRPPYNTVEVMNKVHSDLLSLKNLIEGREYLKKYSEALTLVSSIYFRTVGKDVTLVSLIKKRFQGGLTRGIYLLILQDIVDTISKSSYVTDFSKYNAIIEDKDDIKLEAKDFSTKLDAFNTKVDIKAPLDVINITRSTELIILIDKLGINGVYFLLNALYKIIVIAK